VKVIVVSCLERRAELAETLYRISSTDFPGQPIVWVDPGDRAERASATRHARWRRVVFERTLATYDDEMFVFLEDDVAPARDWFARLSSWTPLGRELLFGSLYASRDVGINLDGRTRHADGKGFFGGQAIVVSRAFLKLVLASWDSERAGELPNWDKVMGSIAHYHGVPATYHRPSLFDHRCAPSLVGSEPHISFDFEDRRS
jgi:hypothetical protein